MDKRPVLVGLLSYGMSGEVFHGPLLSAHPGFRITRVFSRHRGKPATHGHPVVHSLAEVLDSQDVELVIVNTPNETHFEFTRQALMAGKHVVVEKPFTVTRKEADALIKLAREQRRILTVFQNRRWDGDFMTVKKVIDDNLLGRIVEFEAHYDRYRNYVEPGTWKEEVARGTGILYNLGSHMLDQVVQLFGMPQSVSARIGIQRTGGKVDDFYDIRMDCGGVNVIVKSSYLVREQGPRYIIHGTGGSFVKYGIDPQEQALKDKKRPGDKGWGEDDIASYGILHTTIDGNASRTRFRTLPGNYTAFYDGLFDAIRHSGAVPVTPESAANGISLIEACVESNRQGTTVRL